ncbi:MAG: OB-fold protein [Pyrinomonadaceae bacterium]
MVLVLGLLFAVFGCADNDGGESSPASRSRPVPTIAHWQLLKEYADNEVRANSQYTDKRVTVTGPLDYVSVDKGKMIARFSVPAVSYTQLFAEFPDSEKSSVAGLRSGQQIVVECTCLGMISTGRLEMNDCVLK